MKLFFIYLLADETSFSVHEAEAFSFMKQEGIFLFNFLFFHEPINPTP